METRDRRRVIDGEVFSRPVAGQDASPDIRHGAAPLFLFSIVPAFSR
jgi:hypothetical protein